MSDTGRPGKARAERRLGTARHGASLLDRKQRILADELERLQLQADRCRAEWEQAAAAALRWLHRAAALDGRERIRAAAAAEPASVTVQWGGAMGVTYPEEARCTPPDPVASGGSSALVFAAAAHRDALVAAVRAAAAERALALVSSELTATRVRQRAVERRWIPRLEATLTAIGRELDEQELEEQLRLRWAAGHAKRTESP